MLLQETSDGLAVTLGIAAATGLGLLAFTEVRIMHGFLSCNSLNEKLFVDGVSLFL